MTHTNQIKQDIWGYPDGFFKVLPVTARHILTSTAGLSIKRKQICLELPFIVHHIVFKEASPSHYIF